MMVFRGPLHGYGAEVGLVLEINGPEVRIEWCTDGSIRYYHIRAAADWAENYIRIKKKI